MWAAAQKTSLQASTANTSKAFLTYSALRTLGADGLIQLKHNAQDNIYNAPLQASVLHYIDNCSNFPVSNFFAQIPLNMILFASPEVFQTGFVDGFLAMNNDITIEITPGSRFTTGTYDLDIWCCMINRAQLDGQKLSLIESGF